MNRIKLIIVILIASLVVFGFKTLTSDAPVAIVKKVVNDVKFKMADKSDWVNAKTSQTLSDRDEIKTGSKSLAIILFTDGSGQLRVRENAVLHIYGQKDNKKLNKNTFLENGTISFDVNKQADEEFKFTTPTAVASIRGTGGLLGANSDSTSILLEHGSVEFNSTIQGGGGGTITGGQAGTIFRDGRFTSRNLTGNDLKNLQAGKETSTKKVKVKVNNKVLEIEYLSQ
jgi:hypothetical protein